MNKEKLIEEIYKLEQYELVTTGEPGLAISDVLAVIERECGKEVKHD